VSRGAQLVARAGRATVLPDDRAVQRPARRTVPKDDRLALVGDSDRRDVGRLKLERPNLLVRNGKLRLPNLRGVVLYQPRLGVVLLELALRHGADPACFVEDDCA
jgi:hypothetical protein